MSSTPPMYGSRSSHTQGQVASNVLTAVGRALLAPYGLRSLGPDDPAYQGDYGGDPARRDGAYHQGPVWTWLMGAYVDAWGVAEILRAWRALEHTHEPV